MGKASNLENLNLSHTQMTNRGFFKVMSALRSNHTLSKLIADYNNLCSQSTFYSIGQVISNNNSLMHLSLQHCHLIDTFGVPFGEGLRTNKGMQYFNLFGNDLGDKTMIAISNSLREGQ